MDTCAHAMSWGLVQTDAAAQTGKDSVNVVTDATESDTWATEESYWEGRDCAHDLASHEESDDMAKEDVPALQEVGETHGSDDLEHDLA